MQFAPGCFCGLHFWGVSLGEPICKISETARLSCPCQFCHSSALRALFEPQFPAKYCAMIALQVHTTCEMMRFALGCFCSLLILGVSPTSPFAKSQKVRDLGILAKFAIARLYGHFGSRGLQQNVVLCLHFKCILTRRWCSFRPCVFVAYIF